MIFPITVTLILALFLAPIARTVPQPCRNSIFSESSTPVGQYDLGLGGPQPLDATYTAVYNPIYDDIESLCDVACSNLEPFYPKISDIPFFPFLGGAINTTYHSKNCGAIWRLTNIETDHHIDFVSIDDSSSLGLSKAAFLSVGGELSVGYVIVDAEIIGHIPHSP